MKTGMENTGEDELVVWDFNQEEEDEPLAEETAETNEAAERNGAAERKGAAKADKPDKAAGRKGSAKADKPDKASDRKTSSKEQTAEQKEKYSWKKELFSWVMTFVVAIGAALILKNFIIINATVPTGSMENTIMTGDNLFGFRLSYLNSEPERGDIIIFKYPDDETQKYVKRIIGLPGEKITITQGRVYINDSKEPLQEDYLKEEWIRATGPYEFQIPENSYLVMGDNRNNSNDSRYWEHPFVAKDKIIGKALFVYYPFEHFGKIE